MQLKWGKEKMEFEFSEAGSVADLKATILKMTNVPIERMKLSCPKAWKGQLLDTMSLSDCKLKDGMLIMLIMA